MAPKSIRKSGRVGGWVARKWDILTGKVSLEMALKSIKWLRFANAERQIVPDPWGWKAESTRSKRQTTGCIVEQIAVEKRTNVKDFVSWWCCKRSVRYDGWPVGLCSAWKLRWRVWTVCATQAEASEAVWGLHWKRMEDESACSLWTRSRRSKQYHIRNKEFIWSRRDKTSANATQAAIHGIIKGWTDLFKRADVIQPGL